MAKKKPQKQMASMPTEEQKHRRVLDFMMKEFGSTKFVILYESLRKDGVISGAYSDRAEYRGPLDYVGMAEALKAKILRTTLENEL